MGNTASKFGPFCQVDRGGSRGRVSGREWDQGLRRGTALGRGEGSAGPDSERCEFGDGKTGDEVVPTNLGKPQVTGHLPMRIQCFGSGCAVVAERLGVRSRGRACTRAKQLNTMGTTVLRWPGLLLPPMAAVEATCNHGVPSNTDRDPRTAASCTYTTAETSLHLGLRWSTANALPWVGESAYPKPMATSGQNKGTRT